MVVLQISNVLCREIDSDNQHPLLFPLRGFVLLSALVEIRASGFPTTRNRISWSNAFTHLPKHQLGFEFTHGFHHSDHFAVDLSRTCLVLFHRTPFLFPQFSQLFFVSEEGMKAHWIDAMCEALAPVNTPSLRSIKTTSPIRGMVRKLLSPTWLSNQYPALNLTKQTEF